MDRGTVFILQIVLVSTITVSSGEANLNRNSKLEQCVGGICCDNGRFQAPRTVCRAKRDECDLEEFCNGRLSSCPADKRAKDGVLCQARRGRCFQGKCILVVRGKEENIGEKRRIASSDGIGKSLQVGVEHARGRREVGAVRSRTNHRHRSHGRSKPKAGSKSTSDKKSQLTLILLSVFGSVVAFAAICVSVWAWYTRRWCCFQVDYEIKYEPLVERGHSLVSEQGVTIDIGEH